ncbi:MAG: hypothetical protein V7749_18090, partial [Cocleimonas sp.]
IIFVVVSFLLLSNFNNYGNQGNVMLGGSGMMKNTMILGERTPQNTNSQSVQGYQQAKITCTQCHTMIHPNEYTRSEWPSIIRRMENLMRRDRMIMPNQSELRSITNYYVGNSY